MTKDDIDIKEWLDTRKSLDTRLSKNVKVFLAPLTISYVSNRDI